MKLRNDTEGKLQTGENCVVLLKEKTYQDTLLLLIIKKRTDLTALLRDTTHPYGLS